MADTLQQRNVLHFLTGGERALEQIAATQDSQGVSLFTISPPTLRQEEGDQGDTAFTFTLNRAGDTSKNSRVGWQVLQQQGFGDSADSSDFSDGRPPFGSVEFQPGQTSRPITIRVKADQVKEANEAFMVRLTVPNGSVLARPSVAKGMILNDDEVNSHVEWVYRMMGLFRLPVLIILGVIAPLALFLWNWESAIYVDTLKPYLLLLGAQTGSVIVGVLLLGEGIIPFLGLFYSGLRVLQISQLLHPLSTNLGPLPRPLRLVLRSAFILWFLNAAALGLHILMVSLALLQ